MKLPWGFPSAINADARVKYYNSVSFWYLLPIQYRFISQCLILNLCWYPLFRSCVGPFWACSLDRNALRIPENIVRIYCALYLHKYVIVISKIFLTLWPRFFNCGCAIWSYTQIKIHKVYIRIPWRIWNIRSHILV